MPVWNKVVNKSEELLTGNMFLNSMLQWAQAS